MKPKNSEYCEVGLSKFDLQNRQYQGQVQKLPLKSQDCRTLGVPPCGTLTVCPGQRHYILNLSELTYIMAQSGFEPTNFRSKGNSTTTVPSHKLCILVLSMVYLQAVILIIYK